MSSASPLGTDRPARCVSVQSLENGDRLTRAEFERRYEARPDIKKAELIEGVPDDPAHAEFVGRLQAQRR